MPYSIDSGGYEATIMEYMPNQEIKLMIDGFGLYRGRFMNIESLMEAAPAGTVVDIVVFDNVVTTINLREE